MRIQASRSVVALIAAYAIGLQALLSGWILGVHTAEASLGVICTHEGGNPGPHPSPADTCLCGACAMAVHVLAFGLDERPATALAWQPGDAEVVTARDRTPDPRSDAVFRDHRPRGPPQA